MFCVLVQWILAVRLLSILPGLGLGMLGCGKTPGIIGLHGKPSPPSHSVTAESPGHTPSSVLIKAGE